MTKMKIKLYIHICIYNAIKYKIQCDTDKTVCVNTKGKIIFKLLILFIHLRPNK